MADNVRKLSPRLQRLANDEQKSPGKITVRTFTRWTPAKIRAAEQQADAGNLRDAATICEWLLADDAVASGLEARTQALLGLVPSFEPTGDKRRSGVAVKALEGGLDYWSAYPESELEQLVGWRILLGVAPARHDWTSPLPSHGNRVLPNLEFWHPQNLRYDFIRAGWFGMDAAGLEFPIVPGDGIWVLHSLAKHRPWSRGQWRRLSRWVLFKWLAAQDYSRHSEKGAVVVASNTAENPAGDLASQRLQLAEDLQNSGEDAVIVLQHGWTLDLLEISANTKTIYEAQIELANRAISICLRGGNLTTNVEGGSKAATEAQFKSNEQPKLKFDGEGLSTTLHDQSLVWWAEFNFGSPQLAPYPKYPTEPEEDKKAKAETAKTASEAAFKFDSMGFEIDEKVFAEDFGLTWLKGRKSPEERAKEAQAAQPEPTGGDQDGNEDGENSDGAEAGKRATKAARASKRPFALASGAAAAENRGFVEGQLYIDALTDNTTADGIEALDETRKAILEELDAATDFGDLRARLTARYAELSAEQISDLVWRAMTMARLAGHRAVNQDA